MAKSFDQALFQVDNSHELRLRWRKLLFNILVLQLVFGSVAASFYFVTGLISSSNLLLLVSGLSGLHVVLSAVNLAILPPTNRWLSRRLEIATVFAVIVWTLDTGLGTLLVGVQSGTTSMTLFWPPVMIAILGLSVSAVIATAVLSVSTLGLLILLDGTALVRPMANLATAAPLINFFFWAISLVMLLAGLIVFRNTLQNSLNARQAQAVKMSELYESLKALTASSGLVSQRASSLNNELSATSQQLANGAVQQSSAVVEATTSLEEMGQSAGQIAENTVLVATNVNRTLEAAKEVKTATALAGDVASQGSAAVEATINGFNRVNQRIELLAQHLLGLTERSRQISSILDLLNGIADETHLLALNAAIESAGAGEHGQRFGVVAGEVKGLADRAAESTKEVQTVVNELQGSVAAAVLTAEEGRKEAARAVQQAQQAGIVLNKVSEIVTHTSAQGAQIVSYAETASRLVEEIRMSTRQQQSASEQIVFTIRQVKEVAQETAAGSKQVAASAAELAVLNSELTTSLGLQRQYAKAI